MISLGIDIGGTGCKCAAFQDDGAELAQAYVEYPLPPGTVNLSPGILEDSVLAVIAQCAARLSQPQHIAAVTVSSFGESFVPLDESGAPLGDVILYFANSQSALFDHLVAKVGAERFMELTRVYPDASYSLAKMLYTMQIAPRPVWKFLFIASYLVWRLCGEAVCDVSLATRSLLYDVQGGKWSAELLAAAGIGEAQLPTVLPTGAVAGGLRPAMARRLGLPAGIPVVIGAHDQIVNALGAGVSRCGDAVNTTGTCECITPLFSELLPLTLTAQNYACIPYPDGAGYVTYAYNLSGGSVVRWYRNAFAAHLRQQAEQESCSIYDLLNRACPTEPTDLIVLPYLQGMGGTPDINPGAKGLISGLTTATTLPEIYRAILESLCYEMRFNLQQLETAGIRPRRLFAGGGGARSAVWLQIKADIWGCEILPVKTDEAGALGSAILGFAAATGAKSRLALAAPFLRHGEPVRPHPARTAQYEAQYQRFLKLRQLAKQGL